MSDLVGNLEARFSRVAAHFILPLRYCDTTVPVDVNGKTDSVHFHLYLVVFLFLSLVIRDGSD